MQVARRFERTKMRPRGSGRRQQRAASSSGEHVCAFHAALRLEDAADADAEAAFVACSQL